MIEKDATWQLESKYRRINHSYLTTLRKLNYLADLLSHYIRLACEQTGTRSWSIGIARHDTSGECTSIRFFEQSNCVVLSYEVMIHLDVAQSIVSVVGQQKTIHNIQVAQIHHDLRVQSEDSSRCTLS
jgi:hypothetical protein